MNLVQLHLLVCYSDTEENGIALSDDGTKLFTIRETNANAPVS